MSSSSAGSTGDGFAAMLGQVSSGIDSRAVDEYWKAYADDARRQSQLDFYRSMDFEKLAPYEGRLAALGVPVLLVWGGQDPFAPVADAHRGSSASCPTPSSSCSTTPATSSGRTSPSARPRP